MDAEIRFERVSSTFIVPFMEQAKRERIGFISGVEFWAGFVGDVMVGFYGVKGSGDVAHIKNDFTFPEYRKRGYLIQSIKFRLDELRRRGVRRVLANCTSLAVNAHLSCGAKIIENYSKGDKLLEYLL